MADQKYGREEKPESQYPRQPGLNSGEARHLPGEQECEDARERRKGSSANPP